MPVANTANKKLCCCSGKRDTLVSRNPARTKHLVWKRVPDLSCGIICVYPTFSRFDTIPECDRHTHTHRQMDRHTTTAYTPLSIASYSKNQQYCTVKYDYHANERRSIANCYADQEMSVITTYLNNNAQSPLNRFVVYMLYSQLCNKYSDKSNR